MSSSRLAFRFPDKRDLATHGQAIEKIKGTVFGDFQGLREARCICWALCENPECLAFKALQPFAESLPQFGRRMHCKFIRLPDGGGHLRPFRPMAFGMSSVAPRSPDSLALFPIVPAAAAIDRLGGRICFGRDAVALRAFMIRSVAVSLLDMSYRGFACILSTDREGFAQDQIRHVRAG